MEEEKHLVLINPKMFTSQNGTVNEIVKHIREKSTSIFAYGATENLFGILCSSIQALHSRKNFLLAKVQRMNAREIDRLGICPITANIPLLECMRAGRGLPQVRGCTPVCIHKTVEGDGKTAYVYSHQDECLGSCYAELCPLWIWQPGNATLLSFYLPSPDLYKVTSDNLGQTYNETLQKVK